MSMKNPMTPTGIEQATFRFVVQRLNHCATAVLLFLQIVRKIIEAALLRISNITKVPPKNVDLIHYKCLCVWEVGGAGYVGRWRFIITER